MNYQNFLQMNRGRPPKWFGRLPNEGRKDRNPNQGRGGFPLMGGQGPSRAAFRASSSVSGEPVNTNVPPAMLPGGGAPSGTPGTSINLLPPWLVNTSQGLWNHWSQGFLNPEEASQYDTTGAPITDGPQSVPGLGLIGPTIQQLAAARQAEINRQMGSSGIVPTANGLWNVREGRYLTPEEAAAFSFS